MELEWVGHMLHREIPRKSHQVRHALIDDNILGLSSRPKIVAACLLTVTKAYLLDRNVFGYFNSAVVVLMA